MCPRDGYVLFRNSELLCGRLGKQTLGGGNKASLFQVLTAQAQYVLLVACPIQTVAVGLYRQRTQEQHMHNLCRACKAGQSAI